MPRSILTTLLALLLALPGCSGGGSSAPQAREAAPAPKAPNWAFAPKALELTFVSDPFLNEYEGSAHALTVCVYQLADPDAFRRLAASAPGVAKLVECSRFDPAGVVSAHRVTVQPGRNETLTLDRDGSTRAVAVACGYYDLSRGDSTGVFDIPVAEDTSGWLWWKQTTREPAKLSRQIVLGRAGMRAGDAGHK